MNLLIDIDLPGATLPVRLLGQHQPTPNAYGYYSSDENTGPRCGRCNHLLHHHVWQLVNGGDVLDCAVAS